MEYSIENVPRYQFVLACFLHNKSLSFTKQIVFFVCLFCVSSQAVCLLELGCCCRKPTHFALIQIYAIAKIRVKYENTIFPWERF